MTDLADFLLARIAEDQADAVAAQAQTPDPTAGWEAYPIAAGEDEVARHVKRWHPTRVLAECDAKRRILERYQRAQAAVEADEKRVQAGGYSDERGTVGEWDESALRPVLSLLALPYADHPDYRAEWRP